MSRIHEALKKAEQERSAVAESQEVGNGSVGQIRPEAPVLSAEFQRTALSGDLARPVLAVPELDTTYLRFDDLKERCAHPVWDFDPNVNVFANPSLSEHGAEQFRTLRSRLHQTRANQTLRTLLVTSTVPGEGKTFVTVNLAQAIVRQPDRRALII